MTKRFLLICFLIILLPAISFAKSARQFMGRVNDVYPSAERSQSFITAAEDLELSVVNSYVILMQGGIPAERAERFIGWGPYDYRGTNVNLETQRVTTRRGSVYTYLKKGDILAVANVISIGRLIYFKLITPEVYTPINRIVDKHHSRVTLTLIFSIPKKYRENGNSEKVLELLKGWLVPFRRYADAKAFSADTTKNVKELYNIDEEAELEIVKERNEKKALKKKMKEDAKEKRKEIKAKKKAERKIEGADNLQKTKKRRKNKFR